MTFLLWTVVWFLGASIVAVVALVVLRVTTDRRAARLQQEHAVVREVVLSFVMGEDDEVERARDRIVGMRGGEWDRTESQIFSLLPKVRGETRERLVAVVRERGAAQRARQLVRSRSAVIRCRGAHRLGALRDPGDGPVLATLLDDRQFLVRRVALRALGSIGDPTRVPAVLSCADEPAMTRDVVSALQRMGIEASPELRRQLETALRTDHDHDRVAEVAAIALGLIGDTVAVPLLVQALAARDGAVRVAAATALGAIGSQVAVPALVEQLDSDDDRLREVAARALGEIGDVRAAAALSRALMASPRLAARAIAAALLRLGEAGRAELRAHTSPYAGEALAVDALRSAAR
ncbi:HEAT repeat domain-containing protein [Nocardioides sp. JQ2195]|uniref:HEAT repeat domain-containing protein n=1 Tax=Nocardioides sp. JQ2195 TaxID=2592334 RepID=UPI00143EA793|nr:HEAT repeat domain-containing protein [Nocardioides sp. JQ2195]QIX27444.1 HEAT repeat domain-containing protein [Nocardioides sp. JQ2195]